MKDFFNDCARQDEADIQNAIKRGIADPFFDLRIFDDQAGLKLENVLAGSSETGPQQQQGTSKQPEMLSANQALIRRFNFHSIMVLDACRSEKERAEQAGKESLLSLMQSAEKKIKKEEENESQTNTQAQG